MYKILYLHGFHSSPYSAKALEFKKQLAATKPHIEVIAPQLSPLVEQAVTQITDIYTAHSDSLKGVVGSSMGGFLATYLHNQYALPSVVINPAVKPFELFEQYKGAQVHPVTNEAYFLGDEQIEHLKRIYQDKIQQPNKVWLLQQEGDEVLDYKDAILHYRQCKITLEKNGSHGFDNFERFPIEIADFLLNTH